MFENINMPLNPNAKDVYQFMKRLAKQAHDGQKYGKDKPYYYHLEEVEKCLLLTVGNSELLRTMELTGWNTQYSNWEIRYLLKAACFGHDLIEDTQVTEELLRDKEVPEFVIQIILSVTKDDGELLKDYLSRLVRNPFAVFVKQADSFSNLQHSLLSNWPKGVTKYTFTLNYLAGKDNFL